MDNIITLISQMQELNSDIKFTFKISQLLRGRAGIQTLPQSAPKTQGLSMTQAPGYTGGWELGGSKEDGREVLKRTDEGVSFATEPVANLGYQFPPF